jgi:DNA-binding CsgD family transcriptional regulator
MPDDNLPRRLSDRQIDCLKLVATGKSSPEIARILGLSSRTVDQYIADACARFAVKTRVQAVVAAIRLGLI